VIEILQPFEVRAGHTTTVDEHIGGDNNSSSGEVVLSGEGGGSVSTFEDGFALKRVDVSVMDGLLSGSGDETIALLAHEREGVLKLLLGGSGETVEGLVSDHVSLYSLNIKTIRVVDSRVVLADGGDNATFLLEEDGGPVSDSTETLDTEGLVLASKGKSDLVNKGLGVEEFSNGVENTKSGGFGTSLDTTLLDELSSAASFRVDVLLSLNLLVGILDPGHDLLIGAHVRSETIDSGSNEVLLDELHSVLSGNTFEFSLGKISRLNLNSTLGTTEGDVSDSELESHERSEGFDFLEIDVRRVSGSSLDGELVSGVLGSVAGDHFERAIILTEGDVESDDRFASLDEVEVLVGDTSLGGGSSVEKLYLLQETGFSKLIELGTELGSSSGREVAGSGELLHDVSFSSESLHD